MGERDVIIAVDAGTSSVKAVALSPAGEELAAAGVENALVYGPGGMVEQDMDGTWAACLLVLSQVLAARDDLPARVAAIAVTGQGDGTWLIDREGRPVGRALTWLDGRCGALVRDLSPAILRKIEGTTGTAVTPSLQSAQLAWLMFRDPHRLAGAAAALHCKDWLFYRLTGTVASDLSESLFTFGDLATGALSEDVLEAFGIAGLKRLIPAVLEPLVDRSPLASRVAGELGIPTGLPVILAPIDVICSALGSGAIDGGGFHACSILGSAGVHVRLEPRAPIVPGPVVGYTTQLMTQQLWVRYLANMAASLNLDWLADLVGEAAAALGPATATSPRAERLRAIDRLAASARPSQLLYLPYLGPAGERAPFVDPNARAQFVGLEREHGLADLARAVYEGVALAAKDCHVRLGDAAEVRCSGGLVRSETFRQILTDMLGTATRYCRREETGAAGAAMVAAVNLGWFDTLGSAGDAWITPHLGASCDPNAAQSARCRDLFEIYRGISAASAPHWAALRRFGEDNPS
jgi:erythritol kinase